MLRTEPKNTQTMIAAFFDREKSTGANVTINVEIRMPDDMASAIIHVQGDFVFLTSLMLNNQRMPEELLASIGWNDGVMAQVYNAVLDECRHYHSWWLKEYEEYENQMAERDYADQMGLEEDDARERMRSF